MTTFPTSTRNSLLFASAGVQALCLACLLSFLLLLSGSVASAGGRTVLQTDYDDARVGEENAAAVASDIGIMPDEELHAYINGIGHKLLRGVDSRGFRYQFAVVDQTEPNAFALPGGYIFISRGLFALANNEDELACVIGHEITHAAHRHSAAQQQMAQRNIGMGYMRMASMASYGRDMERDADKGGQILCAAAGYDPMGMSTFLQNLGKSVRLHYGYEPGPSFFDSHPGATERAASTAVRAREMRWTRAPGMEDPQGSLYKQLNGLAYGQRPEAGIFKANQFIHPDLGFKINFPRGWQTSNGNQAVGASEPRGEAVVFLRADAPTDNPQTAADDWVAEASENQKLKVLESKPVKVGHIDAWRVKLEASGRGGSISSYITFFPHSNATWYVTGMTPSMMEEKHLRRTLVTARSFSPLTEEERNSTSGMHIRITTALAEESIQSIGERTGNGWTPQETAVFNGVFIDHKFKEGDRVKIAISEPYIPEEKAPEKAPEEKPAPGP